MKKVIPTESEEQQMLVQYLELKKFKFTSIPNSTFTRSWSQKRKNHIEGLRKGLPDLLIVLRHKLLFIELKRTRGGVLSEEQGAWIEALNNIGNQVEAIVCYGAIMAINKIEEELKRNKN